MRVARLLLMLWLASSLSGCGAGTRASVMSAIERGELGEAMVAYERMRSADGADTEVLARIAERVLVREAQSESRESRKAAITELAMVGTAGEQMLRELARRDAPESLLALEVLARRGDDNARRHLRGLEDSSDPEARAASVIGMEIDAERESLLDAMTWPFAKARENAASLLARMAPDGEARDALESASRSDPDAGVRAAAVRALGAYGPAASSVLRERLSDPMASVRMAAVEAMIRADYEQAKNVLGSLFEVPPSVQGIEAARLILAGCDEEHASDSGARSYLIQALTANDPALRAQSGVALVSIPNASEMVDAMRNALLHEPDRGARLAIARALLRQAGADEGAGSVLRNLMHDDDTMNGLQAAATLAALGDEEAIATLNSFIARPDPTLRRTAARVLAREVRRPDDVRGLLTDSDPLVRISAAGGILAASVASR